MTLRIGSEAPDFAVESTLGQMNFHEWIGARWCVLFSHPKDFTPVCTTELGALAKLKPSFDQRNCRIVGVSVDPVDDHRRWAADIETATGQAPNFPLLGDTELKIAKLYGMLPADAGDSAKGRTPVDNHTVRTVFVIGPDKVIKAMLSYPMTSGRNFDEVLRLLDSLQLTAQHRVATPANWKRGDNVIIVASVTDEEARGKYPGGWTAPLPYLRIVPQPAA